jgi:methionine-rich copper-binding protein CopC
MKNFLRICVLLLFVGHSTVIFAHAVVTKHSLKIKSIHANTPDIVEMDFNSKIEPDLSQVFLVRQGDVQEQLKIANGKQKGRLIINVPALETGKYALKLKIFAADGHLTEDLIYFTVTQ